VSPTTHAARPGHPAMDVPMTIARELRELATAALVYPFGCTELGRRALCRPLTPSGAGGDVGPRRTPVVLVHGYGANRSAWFALERRLSREGFRDVHALTYNALTTSVRDVAAALTARCSDAAEEAGTGQVHVLGHSLGGVVLRYAVQRCGLGSLLSTAVTVAAPHRGTRAALLGLGDVAASLRPGSPLLTDLRRGVRDSSLPWVAYYSDSDLVVPPGSARLGNDVPGARDVLVPGVGHLGILRAPAFLDSVVGLLLDRNAATGRAPAQGGPAAPRAA
jgi:pimeloyl-ACP methyl ester carboxylesterase